MTGKRYMPRIGRYVTVLLVAAGLAAGLVMGAGIDADPVAAADLRPPQLLSAVALSHSTIRVTWRDTSTGEDAFGVVSFLEGDESGRSRRFSNLLPAITGVNGTGTYDVKGLTSGTR